MKPKILPLNLFQQIRSHLEALEINDPQLAQLICWLVPAHCPFERTIKFQGRSIVHIPPLCHFNPFYAQLIRLRQKSLAYLVDRAEE